MGSCLSNQWLKPGYVILLFLYISKLFCNRTPLKVPSHPCHSLSLLIVTFTLYTFEDASLTSTNSHLVWLWMWWLNCSEPQATYTCTYLSHGKFTHTLKPTAKKPEKWYRPIHLEWFLRSYISVILKWYISKQHATSEKNTVKGKHFVKPSNLGCTDETNHVT